MCPIEYRLERRDHPPGKGEPCTLGNGGRTDSFSWGLEDPGSFSWNTKAFQPEARGHLAVR